MGGRSHRIALLKGDGIGPEVVEATLDVLRRAGEVCGIDLQFQEYEAGAGYYRRTGDSISSATMEAIGQADAVLLGAMGLPDVRKPDGTEIAPQIDIREHYSSSPACGLRSCSRESRGHCARARSTCW